MIGSGDIRIGVGGWTYAPWRRTFYPGGLAKGEELSYAARALTAIEINGTFYRSQSPRTFARWRDAAPEGFVFAVKAPRFATHRKALADAGASVERFVKSGLGELGEKLGPVLWQFPRTMRFDPADFEAFLALLPETAGDRPLRHAMELRHESFRIPAAVDLARRRGVAIVWAVDSPHPEIADRSADFAYVRLMGTREIEPLGYSDEALDDRAGRLASLAEGGSPAGVAPRDVFCFVIGGYKAANPAAAMALIDRLRRRASPSRT